MTDARAVPAARGQLALALQEAFTVAVRLRAGRQAAADADSFRAHVKTLLSAADGRARSAGYEGEAVKLAIYAYIAFLDESVLSASQPMFAAWSQQPLQEAVFGDHIAGENFFRHLADLLARQDAEPLADLLEVYQLCMLLGFRGKYGSNPEGLQSIVSMTREKIDRIRGPRPPLAPDWGLPAGEVAERGKDVWVPRLAVTALVTFALALGLFLFFKYVLGGQLDGLDTLTASLMR